MRMTAAVTMLVSLLLILHFSRAQKHSDDSIPTSLIMLFSMNPQSLFSLLLLMLSVVLSGSIYLWVLREATSQSVRKEKPAARLFKRQHGTGLSRSKRADNVVSATKGQHQLNLRTERGNNRAKGAVIFNFTGSPARLFGHRLQAFARSVAGWQVS
ncbi:hypothetical protein Q8A73_013138 [Channa argus]|nr:hypothetical protein Q8A73_013138 [Channa argus]